METLYTTRFRRLSEEDVRRFTFSWYKHPAWKIGFVLILVAVLVRWVTR
jgi:hypothetical protein